MLLLLCPEQLGYRFIQLETGGEHSKAAPKALIGNLPCIYSPNRNEPQPLSSAVGPKSGRQSWPLSQLDKLGGWLLRLKLTRGIRGQPQHSLLPRAYCRSASSLDEEGVDESQFPFVLMANNLENSPCLLRTVNDASEITSEIVIKENGRRERHIHTLPNHSFICRS